MSEQFENYFAKLEQLSIDDLDRSAASLALVEKQSVAQLIVHIAEIARRKVDLLCGYRHLYDYCIRRLGLSEGSVPLRVQVANVCRRFPQILEALSDGRIRLSVAGRLATHLREENVEKLLGDCAGMTKREGKSDRVGSSDGRRSGHQPQGRSDREGSFDGRSDRHRPKAGGREARPAASTQCETEGGGSESRPEAERESAET